MNANDLYVYVNELSLNGLTNPATLHTMLGSPFLPAALGGASSGIQFHEEHHQVVSYQPYLYITRDGDSHVYR